MKINKKLKLLLPALLGGIAIASIAPAVVSCSSDNSEEEKPSNPDQGGTGGGDQNPGGGGSGGGDGTKPNPPQMELIPVDSQDQVWAKVQPIIEQYYTPEKAQQDIETYFRDWFTNHANGPDFSFKLETFEVKVQKTNNEDKNTVGTYSITINASWLETPTGEQPIKRTFNQEGVKVAIKPILIKDNTDKNIVKVSYCVQMIDFVNITWDENGQPPQGYFTQTQPTQQTFTINTNFGYLDGKYVTKTFDPKTVYNTYDEAHKAFVNWDLDTELMFGFIVPGKSLPISAKITKGASGDQNNPTPPQQFSRN